MSLWWFPLARLSLNNLFRVHRTLRTPPVDMPNDEIFEMDLPRHYPTSIPYSLILKVNSPLPSIEHLLSFQDPLHQCLISGIIRDQVLSLTRLLHKCYTGPKHQVGLGLRLCALRTYSVFGNHSGYTTIS